MAGSLARISLSPDCTGRWMELQVFSGRDGINQPIAHIFRVTGRKRSQKSPGISFTIRKSSGKSVSPDL